MEVLSSRVIYRTTDLPRLRAFYEGTLGLRVYREYGTGGRVSGVVLFLGGGFLEVTAAATRSSPLTLWLQVPDVRREEDRLREAGVPVVRTSERMPWGLIESWVEDPEGNQLCLVEVPDDHPIRRRL